MTQQPTRLMEEKVTVNETGGTLLSGILLVTGTCIGAGMLALPAVTGLAGFVPSFVIGVVTWLFMTATGLLFLEATLWLKDGANVISIADFFLGKAGKVMGCLSFLFLYYCLMVSYEAGGATSWIAFVEKMTGLRLSFTAGLISFTVLFGAIILWGTRITDRVNWLLMVGLVVSFLLLVGAAAGDVDRGYLANDRWSWMLFATPTLFGAYGYHNIIPSLCTYLNRDVKKLRRAIILGTTLSFVIYTAWQWITIGAIPLDKLQQAKEKGIPISLMLQQVTGNRWVVNMALYFGFFALVTSFLGVALSMVDFLGDGLKVARRGRSRFFLCLTVFVPPALFAAIYPYIFVEAIGIAGGYGEAILNGAMPIAFVWVGRYSMGLKSQIKLFGGKALLVLMMLFTVAIMALETFYLSGG